MEYIIATFILLFIYTSIWAFTNLKKLINMKRLKECVAWSVCKSDSIRWNIPLWAHIKDAQIRCNVPEKYCISWEDEKEYVNDIINVFQKDLIDGFFCGTITYKKINELTLSKPTAKYTDFFIFRLFCFLSNHHCNSQILGHDVYSKQISYKNHGMWGSPIYDAVYEFSDFGRTVQKLYYVTYLACKASEIYSGDIAGWLTPEYFTEDLDSNQIHISRR